MRVLFVTGLVPLAALSCAVFMAPDARVRTRLELAVPSVTPGQRLGLRSSLTHGGRAARITRGSGAGFNMPVRAPSGASTLLISPQPSICPVFDSNVIEPGETDTWESYPRESRQQPAYGQVFRVQRAQGPEGDEYAGHDRVVVIWWRVGASCHRSFPSPAIRQGVSELFLGVRSSAAGEGSIQSGHLRPRDHWIDGLPTIDVAPNAWMYAATIAERPVNVWRDAKRMSVAEFAAFIEHVPRSPDGPASRRLMEWAIADRTRWRLYPAVDYLCHAWRSRGWAPTDSVLAASFLRAGASRCGERRSP